MSLVSRVSAFFLVFLALILLGFSATLYLLARSHFQRDLDERLMVALDALCVAADVESDAVEWRPKLRPTFEAEHPGEGPISWVVHDSRGFIVDHSSRVGTIDLTNILDRYAPGGHHHVTHTDCEGRLWRLALRRLQSVRLSSGLPASDVGAQAAAGRDDEGKTAHPALVLATGVPLAPMEAGLRFVALTLVGLSAGLWPLAAVAGRYVCRRALSPLTLMAGAACGMTADDREQRLPSPGTGDELEDLALSFNGLLGRLHEALVRQERFSGDASHQLRTPLAALRGQIEVALRRERTTDDYRGVLKRLHNEAERLQRIVESLLFLARSGSDAGRPDLEPVDLAAWVAEHLQDWSGHDRAADIRLDVGGDGAVVARVHRGLLGQLLDNLLENAVKYSKPGSPVVVRIRREPGGVAVEVEDRGEGLADEERPHVFEPFYRSPRARRLGTPGVGLGLAVVARIAESFGGSVSADGEPGRWSRFTVRLPAASQPAAVSTA